MTEVPADQLKQPNLASTTEGETTLMKTLLKQRPKKVSHLLQDNLPGRSRFYVDSFITLSCKPVINLDTVCLTMTIFSFFSCKYVLVFLHTGVVFPHVKVAPSVAVL